MHIGQSGGEDVCHGEESETPKIGVYRIFGAGAVGRKLYNRNRRRGTHRAHREVQPAPPDLKGTPLEANP